MPENHGTSPEPRASGATPDDLIKRRIEKLPPVPKPRTIKEDIETFEKRIGHPNTLGLYIYFVQAGWGGPIKIGISGDVRKRIETMQPNNHEKLEILGVMKGDKEREERWHKRFKHLRLRGEWYYASEELLDAIEHAAVAPDHNSDFLTPTHSSPV